VESILGFSRQGAFLLLDPCIPRHWPGYEITYRHGATRYDIVVENPNGVCRGIASLEVDGQFLSERPPRAMLVNDGKTHKIHVVLG
jgi:cyclic beta-1,2-glucan synthetase